MDIDRRMLDFLVGLDTEFSDMVDGSHLYFPSAVQLEDVVLPQDQKKLIVETVENFAAYKKVRKALGLDKTGVGLLLLGFGVVMAKVKCSRGMLAVGVVTLCKLVVGNLYDSCTSCVFLLHADRKNAVSNRRLDKGLCITPFVLRHHNVSK